MSSQSRRFLTPSSPLSRLFFCKVGVLRIIISHYYVTLYFQVNVSLNLRNIFEVNEKAQYITLETSLRMYWKDERIQGVPIGGNDFVNVNGKEIDNFWIPDVFIDQAKALRVPNFYVKPSTIRVYADGTLR